LISDLKNSSKRLTLEEFSKKHQDTFNDINLTDDPDSRKEYRRQLNAERRRRMKLAEKRKKKEGKDKKKKKRKKEKKKKRDVNATDDDDSDEEAVLKLHMEIAARNPVAARPHAERDTVSDAKPESIEEQVAAAVRAASILARRARMRRPEARARPRETIWAPDPGEDKDS